MDSKVDPKGVLTAVSAENAGGRSFSAYIHVPFCQYRCGYCDFNTYTNTNFGVGASIDDYVDSLVREYAFAKNALSESGVEIPLVSTVFFGGGTPTYLSSDQLIRALEELGSHFELAPDVEVTTEANPETVDDKYIADLADAGFTRISFGAQSALPHVLQMLDRQHDPAKLRYLVDSAKDSGLQTSVDFIYATPNESLSNWQETLEYATALDTDHISAYALTIHDGTKMGQMLKSGKIPPVNSDDEAQKYELATEYLGDNGYTCYEISNWSKTPQTQCRHNIAYWKSQNWWGFGAGAHSYVGKTRWWNLKHPRVYASKLLQAVTPAAAKEELDDLTQLQERIMLEIRLAQGLSVNDSVIDIRPDVLQSLVQDGYIDKQQADENMVVLTLKGRLMADYVTAQLWEGLIADR